MAFRIYDAYLGDYRIKTSEELELERIAASRKAAAEMRRKNTALFEKADGNKVHSRVSTKRPVAQSSANATSARQSPRTPRAAASEASSSRAHNVLANANPLPVRPSSAGARRTSATEDAEANRHPRSGVEARNADGDASTSRLQMQRTSSVPPHSFPPTGDSSIANRSEQIENVESSSSRVPLQEMSLWTRSNNSCNGYMEGIAAGVKMQERLREAECAKNDLAAGLEACQAALHASELENRKLSDELSNLKDLFICIECMDEPRSSLLQPCGHLALCSTCAATVNRCPICRAAVASTAYVVLS